MKKTLLAGLVVSAMIAAAPAVNAAGVPTMDVLTVATLNTNALAQAQQALDALKQAKEGIEQARAQYENYKGMVSGNSNFGDFLDNPTLNKIMPIGEWEDVYNDAKDLPDLRERYNLRSDDPVIQKQFDKLLAATGVLEKNYDASTERVKNAQQLREQLNVVQTPQEKADLQLRYQQEMLELENQKMRMENMKMLMEQKEKVESKQRSQAFEDYVRGKSKTLPQYN
ncbi:VirB5 (plasmid) [Pseudomonas fluorescens R124]|uniref:VirB5 n=1 Tax=Pseudomonas fluorescens R124 TaxID=743713 RepID=K0WZZ4_PSEFL|nr:P-type DNA transfer protein VirB5 [Pseudomonas fluorescens]AFS51694.1 VirB5 [Pseudomonas fluorescens R124]EJZ60939.1 VirB5 [Pseudomonas fluorescens R124]